MSRYRALQEEQAKLKAEWDGIIAKAEGENRVDLSVEETGRVGEIKARLTAVKEGLDQEEERRAWERTVPAAAQFHGVHDRAEDRPFASFGEQLVAIAEAGMPGGRVDPRLYADISGASVQVPTDGGFMVRKEFSTALLDKAVESSVLAPLCDSYPVSDGNDGLEAPMIDETNRGTGTRWGGVQVYRISEADTVTAKKPKLGKFELRLEDMMGLAYATERLLRDAPQMEAVFTKSFTSEFAFKLDDEIINGTGAGQCLGVLNSGALVSVAKEVGQAPDTVVTENLSKMWARCHSRSKRNAVWLINTDVNPQLDQLALAVGMGALEPRFVTYGPDGVLRIKGRPVVEIEQASTLGDKGDVMLVDFGQYVLLTKGGIQAAQSMHVRFLYNERTFRWVYPIIGKPAWSSPLTPYKGTGNTVSPFVTLDARA